VFSERITFGLSLERASPMKISLTRPWPPVAVAVHSRGKGAPRTKDRGAACVASRIRARGLPRRMARQGSARLEQALAPIIGTMTRPPTKLSGVRVINEGAGHASANLCDRDSRVSLR
jgi:hypothetical protein